MGYKQQNNPFSRRISSPLQHNVTNAAGESWRHAHNNRGRTVSLEAKNIAGSSDFGQRANRAVKSKETGTKRLSEERGGGRATEKNYAMDYANQLADMYNRGELIGGQFIADDFDKRKSKLSIKNNKVKIKPRFKSVGESKDYNVQYADEVEGFDPEVGYQAAETQYTPDQIYDMMVQGGGMVSIVDGKIVAGNPNEVKYELTDADRENPTFSGTSRYSTSYRDADYVPEGYMDERSTTKVDPSRKLTVKELLERRKQKSNSAINRVMSNSPLNQGHETDERSNQTFNLQEGYDYQDPVVTVTEGEWVNDPNNPGQQMRVITTDESITGKRKNLNPGGLGQGQAENWIQLKEDICSGRKKGDTSICDDTQNISNSVTEYRPIEVETEEEITTTEVEEPVVQRDRFSRDSGSIRGKGLEFTLPQLEMMSLPQLRAAKSKCGKCKSAGLINVLLGRRSG
jgi:hypothetical protein|tara:strand:+ start:1079 stop:2449 length:1371 start_codon:yes stop_codon:yes gene_type:complete